MTNAVSDSVAYTAGEIVSARQPCAPPPLVVTMLVAFAFNSSFNTFTLSYVGVPVILERVGIGKVSMYFSTVVTELVVMVMTLVWC